MTITKQITLDVSRPNNIPSISAKQFDEDSRFLKINLINGTEDISVESDSAVLINIARADGESNSYSGSVNEDGSVTVPLSNWLLSVEGTSSASVSIIQNGERLTSLSFDITVQPCESAAEPTEDETNVWDLILSDIAKLKVDNAENKVSIQALGNKELADYFNSLKGIGYTSETPVTADNFKGFEEYVEGGEDRFTIVRTLILGDGHTPNVTPYYEPLSTTSVKSNEAFYVGDTKTTLASFKARVDELIAEYSAVGDVTFRTGDVYYFRTTAETENVYGTEIVISAGAIYEALKEQAKAYYNELLETINSIDKFSFDNSPEDISVILKEV